MSLKKYGLYATTSLCHHCHSFEYVYLHIFQFNIFLKRHFPCGHRISHPVHNLQRTNNKPFAGFIGLKYMTKSLAAVHQSWVVRCSSRVLRKHLNTTLYIWSTLSRAHKTVTIIHNCCYSLMTSPMWRPNIWYRKINITSFIFSWKNV